MNLAGKVLDEKTILPRIHIHYSQPVAEWAVQNHWLISDIRFRSRLSLSLKLAKTLNPQTLVSDIHMGIKDLLRFIKPYIQPIHIAKYAGKRVGIDAYSWLHKGAYSCSMALCLDSYGNKKLQYLNYFMHRINLLRHHQITPVVVFDGGSLPFKAATEQQRHMKRTANRELAMEKLREGNLDAASELFQKAVSVTPYMAHKLIQILRSENIEFVVAPYEADAQLAYLSNLDTENGGVVAVITEDSDLMAYGCEAIVFKMDKYGNGEEIMLDRVFGSAASKPSFQNFDKELFTGMCVLAGCDFLPSVPGIGIGRAHSYVSKYRNLQRVLSVLKLDKGDLMPEDYSKSFMEAVAVFQHAQIYDPQSKRLKHLKPISQELMESLVGELDFLGPQLPPSIAIAIAEGNLDPRNMVAFDHLPRPVSPDTISSKTIGELDRPESCFMVVSSNKSNAKDITVVKQSQASNESKYLKEAAALEKLILPSKMEVKLDAIVVSDDSSLKVPNNNPFKKRKADSQQISVVTKDDDLDVSCVTPDSDPLEISEDEKDVEIEICRKQMESQVAVVTKVENSDLCMTISSQESAVVVDSTPKTKRIGGGKGRKSNARSCKSSEKSKGTNTILKFFSRV